MCGGSPPSSGESWHHDLMSWCYCSAVVSSESPTLTSSFPFCQAELVQPPSMMEKQAKTTKPKSEKKVKAAESPAPEEGRVQPQPAQTIEGTFLLSTAPPFFTLNPFTLLKGASGLWAHQVTAFGWFCSQIKWPNIKNERVAHFFVCRNPLSCFSSMMAAVTHLQADVLCLMCGGLWVLSDTNRLK